MLHNISNCILCPNIPFYCFVLEFNLMDQKCVSLVCIKTLRNASYYSWQKLMFGIKKLSTFLGFDGDACPFDFCNVVGVVDLWW